MNRVIKRIPVLNIGLISLTMAAVLALGNSELRAADAVNVTGIDYSCDGLFCSDIALGQPSSWFVSSTSPATSLNTDALSVSSTSVGNTSNNTTINGLNTELYAEGLVTIQGGAGNTDHTFTDVLIASANYNGSDPKYGSAIKVSDVGVEIITPPPALGSNYSNNMVGNSGDGAVTNNFGGLSGTSATGSVTNIFGSNSNSGGGVAYNEIGTGSGQSDNKIGNGNKDTSVSITAGNSEINLQNGVSTTRLQSGDGVGASSLPGGGTTGADSGAVLAGATGRVAAVNSNGKITLSTGLATESSANMTITNGVGNTHGFFVNEHQATMSGGINSTSMTLNDNGATFTNAANGAPVQVHGVYDGTAQFDAVNVRQLYGAVAASMATVPTFTLEPGESGIGIGTGIMGTYPAIGVSYATKNKDGSQFNLGVAAAQHVPLAVRAGFGWVW